MWGSNMEKETILKYVCEGCEEVIMAQPGLCDDCNNTEEK
jgi:hypothetical protein